MISSLRLFIAVELSAQIQQALAALINDLKKVSGREVKWGDAQQIHLTIKFLGETRSDLVPRIKQTLETVALTQPEFLLLAKGTGVFPNPKQPRILWAGLSLPVELVGLQNGVENSLISLGFARETRPFSPHLTLGRVSENANSAVMQRVVIQLQSAANSDFGSVKIQKVTLFQSTLTPRGPIYTPLGRFSLKNLTEFMLK